MTLAVRALLIWALLLGGAHSREQSPGFDQKPPAPTRVTLTDDHPEGFFLIPPEILSSPPPVLALNMTQVVNPAETPFQVFVYLSCRPGSGAARQSKAVKLLVGNVGLFPPDRPARFLLRASTAFRKLKATNPNPADVRLLLEMKRIHETKPWTRVEVTVAPPEWRREDETGRKASP
jgi:hypothetical protein